MEEFEATNCEEMKQLHPLTKAIVFMRKNLRQAIADTKQEVQKAEEFANSLGIIVPDVVAEEKKLEKDEVCIVDLIRFIYLYFIN